MVISPTAPVVDTDGLVSVELVMVSPPRKMVIRFAGIASPVLIDLLKFTGTSGEIEPCLKATKAIALSSVVQPDDVGCSTSLVFCCRSFVASGCGK